MPENDIQWEMLLRGAVAGLLLFHVIHLALPGRRPAARAALAVFTLSVLAYVFCQQSDVLFSMPRPLTFVLVALCVSSTAWMWIAARALFNDHFVFSARLVVTGLGMVALGLIANLPYFSEAIEAAGTMPLILPRRLLQLHAVAMLAFTAAALREIIIGWRDDLVEPRRAARRWVAMGIGLYAAVALLVELALRGEPIGRLLPALHVAGIGAVTLALALLVARHSLDEVLGMSASMTAVVPVSHTSVPEAAAAAALAPRVSATRLRLQQAMDQQHLHRREGLTLAALAQALNVGEATLRGQINQELGYRNFNDFLHHYRLREATTRLATEDLPVLSIALECGYGSIGPFNRAFKQRMGMTPSEYRGASRLSGGSTTN
jgi:AraC-like DNA-binding protein